MDYALDTETLSLRSDAVIVNVGLVCFDRKVVENFSDIVSRGITVSIDMKLQRKVGRVETDDVIAWWNKLPEEARAQLKVPGLPPSLVMRAMCDYFERTGGDKDSRWYCRGSHFDIAKLENLFDQFEVRYPWHYRKPRCSRTALDEMGIKDDTLIRYPADMIPHNSLHDAAFEAYILQRATNRVKMDVK